jgi:hypothetical protein
MNRKAEKTSDSENGARLLYVWSIITAPRKGGRSVLYVVKKLEEQAGAACSGN